MSWGISDDEIACTSEFEDKSVANAKAERFTIILNGRSITEL